MVGYMTECTQSTDSKGGNTISIKWSNGLWIWVKNYQETAHACTEAHGNIYYKDFTNWYFPSMENVYGIFMFNMSGPGTHWFQVQEYDTTNKTYSGRICNAISASRTFKICTFVIGTWK